MEDINRRLAIETLEYLHDMLDQPEHEERRGHVKAMIAAFRAGEKEAQGLKQATVSPYPYIPPGL